MHTGHRVYKKTYILHLRTTKQTFFNRKLDLFLFFAATVFVAITSSTQVIKLFAV